MLDWFVAAGGVLRAIECLQSAAIKPDCKADILDPLGELGMYCIIMLAFSSCTCRLTSFITSSSYSAHLRGSPARLQATRGAAAARGGSDPCSPSAPPAQATRGCSWKQEEAYLGGRVPQPIDLVEVAVFCK